MSHPLRSGKKNSKFMMVIMGLLMLGLTGFGIGGFGGGNLQSIGTVGEESIPVNTYARSYRNAINQLSNRAGRNLSPSEVEQFGISASVLDAVIGLAAIDNEASQLGLSVGDDIVRQQIISNPNFQGLTGSFDKQSYEFYLDRQLNLTPKQFDALLRKENARSILEGSISGGISSSDAIPLALISYVQETRDFDWAWVTELQLAEPVADATDAQLQQYYDSNGDKYQSLRSHNVTYVWLSPEMLLEKVDVAEAELRESYEFQADRFNKPEQRALERIVFSTQQEAQDARDSLDALTITFAQLAEERGLTLADVDLGDVEVKDLSNAAAELVFGSESIGIVGPVDSALGPALFRINAVLAADSTSFEEAREELTTELAGEGARRMVSDMVNDIDDLLAAGASVEDLGAETSMQLGTIDFTDQSTGGLNGYTEFRKAIQEAKEGDFPEITDLSDGGIFALKVNKVTEPALIPYTNVKSLVAADWKQAETLARLKIVAEAFKSKLEGGSSFADLSLAPNTETAARRDSFFQGMPSSAIIEVFNLETDAVLALEGVNGVFLARLTGVNAFDAASSENATAVAQLTNSLNAQIGADVLELYTAALRSTAGVSLNQTAINSINAQIATR
ncbi:MAG: SurA N-terminal domain-containing protein [Rhodobacteraceae bacterium]|nr:SurA N-terminal domain-containing protein [Paracoccaceae bacterium]